MWCTSPTSARANQKAATCWPCITPAHWPMARSLTRGEHHYVLSEFRTIEHSLCSARAAADSLSSHKLNFPFVCFQHMIWLTLCIHNSLHLINIVQLLSGSGFLTAPKCLQCVSGEKNKPLIINRYLAIKDEIWEKKLHFRTPRIISLIYFQSVLLMSIAEQTM